MESFSWMKDFPPPVRAREVARALGIEVRGASRGQLGGVRALALQDKGKCVIYFDATVPEKLINFRIAHEIFELLLPEGEARHREANRLAVELLLPEEAFLQALRERGPDVTALSEEFFVSAEAVARRILEFCEMEVHIVDNGFPTRYYLPPHFQGHRGFLPEEEKALKELDDTPKTVVEGRWGKVHAFRIQEGSPVVRKILLVEPFLEGGEAYAF